MYSLLVSNEVEDRNEGVFGIERSRFLEYTTDQIALQLRALSIEARESIKSWPCILMPEGRGEEKAYLVNIRDLSVSRAEVTVTVSPVPGVSIMTNDALWKMRNVLDVGDFEFSRHHWAIKDRDLFEILGGAGYIVDSASTSQIKEQPLPAPQRAELLRARDVISGWSHTQIDDLLLEAGVTGIAADKDLGNRRDRANAIVKFAFDHPSETTAENSLLSAFIARRARGSDTEITRPGLPPASDARDTPTSSGSIEIPPDTSSRSPNRVFVVHGQNEAARDEVVSFLESVGLEGIVLHEQPNMGRHLLTKFIEEAELVTFAIVLMTDDDVGARKDATLAPRARQNVILELGYFLSHLGQPRVCALITPGLQTPSDFDGIVYIRMAEDGKWRGELSRELKAARMPLTT